MVFKRCFVFTEVVSQVMASLGALFQSVTGWKVFVSQKLTEVDGPEEAVSMAHTK